MDNTYLVYLQNQKSRLESRKRDLMNFKFMGGGFGLLIFLFISMGLGIILWIVSAFINNNELNAINQELSQINSQLFVVKQQLQVKEAA